MPVESQLWNVHGLALKVVFEGEFSYADSTQDMNQLPLYDQIDDDTINQYRRNIPYWDYGAIPGQATPLPYNTVFGPDGKYDPRSYLVRRGMGGWVTGPAEIAQDLTAFRLAARQRHFAEGNAVHVDLARTGQTPAGDLVVGGRGVADLLVHGGLPRSTVRRKAAGLAQPSLPPPVLTGSGSKGPGLRRSQPCSFRAPLGLAGMFLL